MVQKSNPPISEMAFSEGGSIELAADAGPLVIESAEDKISFMSDFDIGRDAKGLALAKSLMAILAGAVACMERDQGAGQLPETRVLAMTTTRPNPLD